MAKHLFLDEIQNVKALVDEILTKDIYRRFKLRKRGSFDVVMRYLINNFARPTSKQNILKGLEKGGFKIKESTLTRYIRALEGAKILYPCLNFDLKSKRSLKGERKYYLSDLSFTFLTEPSNISAYGPCLENIVYVYARESFSNGLPLPSQHPSMAQVVSSSTSFGYGTRGPDPRPEKTARRQEKNGTV